jgi:hypothetical protein
MATIIIAHMNEHTSRVAIDLSHNANLMSLLVQIVLVDGYEVCPYTARCIRLAHPLKYPEKVCGKSKRSSVADDLLISNIASPYIRYGFVP